MSLQKTVNSRLHLIPLTLLTCLTMAGCGTLPGNLPGGLGGSQTDGPGKAVDTTAIADAIPKVEPIKVAGNKNPYRVFGKTYVLLPSSKGYREQGVASWYGKKFHGRKTSNGEVYDMYAMTAAHKTLPIPAYARVTNLDNKRSVIVRINDRGPFHGDRLIDLSYVAALKLGFADKGTANVIIEAIDPSGSQDRVLTPFATGNKAAVKSSNQKPLTIQGRYLQVGAFDALAPAQVLQKQVRGYTQHPILVQQKNTLYKVWIGPISDHLEFQRVKQQLKKLANISSFMVVQ